MPGRWTLHICLAAMFALSVQPSRAADQTLIEAATREGVVAWYTSLVQNQVGRPLVEKFQKKYPGITVQASFGTQNDLLLKIVNEKRAGRPMADVVHGGSSLGALTKADLIEPFATPTAIPYAKETRDDNGLWTAQTLLFQNAAVNTDLVAEKDIPRSYEDLLDPKWKGKIAWTTSLTQGGPPGFIATVLESMGEKKGMDYLRRLSKQQIVNVPSNQRVTLDKVIAGEYPIALMVYNHHALISAKQGASVKWLALSPTTAVLDTVFLVKDRPHPNAGKLFVEFLLSEEGQSVFRDAAYIPAHPGVAANPPELKPDIGKFDILVLSPATTDRNLSSWIKIYDELFK